MKELLSVCIIANFGSYLSDTVFSIFLSVVLSLKPVPVLSNSEQGPVTAYSLKEIPG